MQYRGAELGPALYHWVSCGLQFPLCACARPTRLSGLCVSNEDMEGMDGDIHDRFERLEFDDASADSLTNKDGSDDQQDEGN